MEQWIGQEFVCELVFVYYIIVTFL